MNYTRHTLVGICLILLVLVVAACKQRASYAQVKDVVTIGPGDNTALFYTEVVDDTEQFVIEICEGFIEINKRQDCIPTAEKRFFERQALRQQLLQALVYFDNSKLTAKNKQMAERYREGITQPELDDQKTRVDEKLKALIEDAIPEKENQLQMFAKKLDFFDNPHYLGTWKDQDRNDVHGYIKNVTEMKSELEKERDRLMLIVQGRDDFAQAKTYIEGEVDQLLELIKRKGIDMKRTFLSTQHGGWIFYNAAYRIAFPINALKGYLESIGADGLADMMVSSSYDLYNPFVKSFFDSDSTYLRATLKIGRCKLQTDWWGSTFTVVRFGSQEFSGPFQSRTNRFKSKKWVKTTIRAHYQEIMHYLFSDQCR